MVRAVFFDIGETLVNERRPWSAWADWLGVPHHTFFAAFGALIERGGHHREVFELFRPGFDLDEAERQRLAMGRPDEFGPDDFYPDAVPCLRELEVAGIRIGLAGNQPSSAEEMLRRMDLPVEWIASSASWGVEKPSPAFFQRLIATCGLPAQQIAYVGDRLDNDVLPAREAGLVSVFIRRGPWGVVHARRPEVERAHLRLESLLDLPRALREQAP